MNESDFIFEVILKTDKWISHAAGQRLYFRDGEYLIDWFCDTCNLLGHGNDELVLTLSYVIDKGLFHIPQDIQSQDRLHASINLLGVSDLPRGRVFWSNSGTEAIETGIKLLRKHHNDKYKAKAYIVSIEGGFHGRTYESLSISSGMPDYYTQGYEVLKHNITHITPDERGYELWKLYLRDDPIAGVILEPFQGANGDVRPIQAEFMFNLIEDCHNYDIPIMVDEVQSFARTGKWFAYEHYGLNPDIICLAKGIAGGLPCGVTMASNRFRNTFTTGTHYSTFGGSPIICAAVNAVFLELASKELVTSIDKYAKLRIALTSIKGVKEVRGNGYMLAVDTEVDAIQLGKALRDNDNIRVCAIRPTHFKITPPLDITENDIDHFVSAVKDSIGSLS